MTNNYSVVDLFCGVGGLTNGFIKEGFNVVAGLDIDESCQYAFQKNNNVKFINKDVDTISSKFIRHLYPEGKKKILIGCAPCQPFSLYAQTTKKEQTRGDTKWKLLYSFGRLIEDVNPSIVSMENVPQLSSFKNGRVFNDFLKLLENLGYHVSYYIVNAQDYGVPQRRKRLILFASKKSGITIIPATHSKGNFITVRQAISTLPAVEDGAAYPTDFLHRAKKMEPLTKERIKATPEGGSWRDWPKSLISKCHRKKGGKEFGSVYGRMKWDDVSPTLTTFCTGYNNGRFGHPEQDRGITLREAAILQSFPVDYDFLDPNKKFSHSKIQTHIGNAVPVKLGQVIAKSIMNHITAK